MLFCKELIFSLSICYNNIYADKRGGLALRIQEMKLQSFRNISEVKIECHPSLNIIWGNNGQGKTNLLEAISCLSLGKSFRVSSDKPLLQFTKPLFYLNATGTNEKGSFRLDMAYDGVKKKVKVNGVEKKRLVDFVGNIRTVTFSPDDLSLVKEGRAERRKFLDTMLCQISNRYCINLATYQKVVEQRNKLLKERPPKLNDLLIAWDLQLVQYAAEIWLMRYKAVLRLEELAIGFFQEVTDSSFDLSLTYQPSIGEEFFEITENTTKEELCQLLLQTFQKNRGLEISRGYTLFGPHRDDLPILINDMDSKLFASQGQQRLIALSLKIAEMHYIEERTDESPILLLDDIFSELDPTKIDNLLSVLNRKDRQVFITTTDKMDLPFPFQSWIMESGVLRKDLT